MSDFITRDDARRIAEEAARKAIERERGQRKEEQREIIRETIAETLLTMGMNVESNSDKTELQNDMHFLRRFRQSSTAATLKLVATGFTAVILGILAWAFAPIIKAFGG